MKAAYIEQTGGPDKILRDLPDQPHCPGRCWSGGRVVRQSIDTYIRGGPTTGLCPSPTSWAATAGAVATDDGVSSSSQETGCGVAIRLAGAARLFRRGSGGRGAVAVSDPGALTIDRRGLRAGRYYRAWACSTVPIWPLARRYLFAAVPGADRW